jgi:hypothetical protein
MVALLAAAPALAGCIGGQVGPWNLTLTLGGILGASAGDGNDVRVAFQTAVTQITTANVGLKVNAIYEPATNGDAAAAYDRLVARGAAAVVDLRGAADATALVQHAQSAPLLLPALENASLTTLSYRLAPDAGADARALDALAKRVGASSLAVAFTDDAYGWQVAQALVAMEPNATLVPDHTSVGSAVCAAHASAVVLVMGPAEALRVLQFIQGAGCRAQLKVLGAPEAFGIEPNSPQDVSLVQGVVGAAPDSAREALLRSILRSVDSSTAPPFSSETFDAVDAVALAELASHGGAGKERVKVEGAVSAGDVNANLLRVLSSPGIKQHDFATAAESVKAGDDIDWQGYANDFDVSGSTHAPVAGHYVEWAVTSDGSSELRSDVLLT